MAEADPAGKLEINRNVNLAKLRWPSNKGEAGSQNRQYVDFSGYSWEDLVEILPREEAIVSRYSRLDGEALEEVDPRALEENITGDDWEEWYQELGGCLDIGVASAVVALSAARCLTTTSCNGARDHQEAYPVVVFWCKPAWVSSLLSSAEEAGCGLINSHDGTLMVYAPGVPNLLAFARALLARR